MELTGCNPGTKGCAYSHARVHITPAFTPHEAGVHFVLADACYREDALSAFAASGHLHSTHLERTSSRHERARRHKGKRRCRQRQHAQQCCLACGRMGCEPCHSPDSCPASLSELARSAHSCRETRSCMWKSKCLLLSTPRPLGQFHAETVESS